MGLWPPPSAANFVEIIKIEESLKCLVSNSHVHLFDLAESY